MADGMIAGSYELHPRTRDTKGVAAGSLVTVAVRFPPGMFDNINCRARVDGVSFAEAVRRLIAKGFEHVSQ